jgi:hypothetical protein
VSCGSVSFGNRLGDLYSQPGDLGGLDDDLHHAQSSYRSLPHRTRSNNPQQQQQNTFSHAHYPNYSSTASTPRRPQQGTLNQQQQLQLQQPHLGAHGLSLSHGGESLLDIGEYSAASDNHSENTVIEQQDRPHPAAIIGGRRASNSRSIVSIQSGGEDEAGTGFLVVQGVSGPVAHMVGVDDHDEVDDMMMEDDGGVLSSEDNLSHDSYELIEKIPTNMDLSNKGAGAASGAPSNHFEQEFYRQAAASKGQQKNGGLASSSRTSSHCSLSMSPQVLKRGPTPIINKDPSADRLLMTSSNPASASNSMSRVKSQDSFSQASNHSNLNNNPSVGSGEMVVASSSPASELISPYGPQQPQQQQLPPVDEFHGHEQVVGGLQQLLPDERLMVDIVRCRGVHRQQQPHLYLAQPPLQQQYHHLQQPHGLYSHSLPRSNAEGYILYQQQVVPVQPVVAGSLVPADGQYSRTLPSRRRERSPVYYSRSRLAPGGSQNIDPCSSGSSSSHASPHIARPKSLEFSVVSVNALPNKQAYSYHDDSLELQQQPQLMKDKISGGAQPVVGGQLGKPMDPYDDSSSAVSVCPNDQLSSSDVPQTPENPNVTFLPLEAGPVIVGCHQGVVRGLKQYYPEERIYDVPEGIEGVNAPITITTMAEVITSPSSSSGITDPFVPKKPQKGDDRASLPPPTVPPPPVPPPHQPVIAQHVRHSRPPRTHKLPKVDIDPRKFHSLISRGQDSTESCDSNSAAMQPHQRPLRPSRGRGGHSQQQQQQQQHHQKPQQAPPNQTSTLPTPQRALLSTMSSTESESAMSARSAPTPISNPEQLIKTPNGGELDDDGQEDTHGYEDEFNAGDMPQIQIIIERGPMPPSLQVNLISPPGEESESSTAVMDSEGVPAPPPEFSGAGIVSDEDAQEATDVEEESQTQSNAAAQQQQQVVVDHDQEAAAIAISESLHYEIADNGYDNKDDIIEPPPSPQDHQATEVSSEKEEGPGLVVEDTTTTASESKTTTAILVDKNTAEEEQQQPREVLEQSPDSPVIEPEEEEEASSSVIKIADLYVRLEHNGSGSTISDEGNTGSDIAPVLAFIDDEKDEKSSENDLIETLDGMSCGGTSEKFEVVNLPIQQHAEPVFIPPTPTNLSKSSDNSLSATTDVETAPTKEATATVDQVVAPTEIDIPEEQEETEKVDHHDEEDDDDLKANEAASIERLPSLPTFDSSSSMDIDIGSIPPPSAHEDLLGARSKKEEASVADSSSSTSPLPPPPMLLDGTEGPPTAILSDVAGSFPFPPRTLSRISEGSASTTKPVPELTLSRSRSRSGSEGPAEDTMSDQNYTTSDDADNNPPSLCSDLPENVGGVQRHGGSAVLKAIADIEARTARQSSKDLPSPPSSMLEATTTTTTTITQECKTEVTLFEPDSLYLEITADIDDNDDDEDAVGALDKVPYDLSISSENEVTNKERSDGNNSEGSLHDSMEILEEVATEDHFENDMPAGDDDDDEDDHDDDDSDDADGARDIFEMPPIPNVIDAQDKTEPSAPVNDIVDHYLQSPMNEPPAPVGGQEYIL